jgi:hypothetical protein
VTRNIFACQPVGFERRYAFGHQRKGLRSLKVNFKDALTIGLSVAAFILSGVTTYISVVRQADDLSVVIYGFPMAFRSAPDRFFPGSQTRRFHLLISALGLL